MVGKFTKRIEFDTEKKDYIILICIVLDRNVYGFKKKNMI